VITRKAYPSAVGDDAWAVVAPYLTHMTEEAPQREHRLREVFTGLRWIVRAGAAWRMLPHDLPPWPPVDQQSQRWLTAGVFDAIGQDLRAVLRLAQGRKAEPSAAICDSRTRPSTPESGTRAGYDGAQRRRGAKVPSAVATLGHLLALHVPAANEQDRSPSSPWAATVPEVTGDAVEVAFVDQGYTGDQAAQEAEAQQMSLEVVKRPEAKNGCVLLPRRWIVERSNAWAARFHRLARDYERLAETLAGLAFCGLRDPDAQTFRCATTAKCITRSRDHCLPPAQRDLHAPRQARPPYGSTPIRIQTAREKPVVPHGRK
jgi:transposase